MQIQKKLLSGLTTFCISTDLSVHPRDPGNLNSVGRKGWIVLLATVKDLGTSVQTTIRLGH